jgi:hypothetical protein
MMGDLYGRCANSLFITMENSREESLVPRALAAGFDMNRPYHFDGNLDLPDQMDVLCSWVKKSKAKLVVIDTGRRRRRRRTGLTTADAR